MSRLALDQPIERERASEAITALAVVQRRHFDLAGQQLPQQLACMGRVPAKERLDVSKARLEHLLQPRQIGGPPVREAGPFERSDHLGLPGLLGVEATNHLVLGGLPIGQDVQKPGDAAFDLVEVSFYLRLSPLRLLALGFEAVQGLVERAGEQRFVQNLTDGGKNSALDNLVAHHDPIRAHGTSALVMDRTAVEADGMTVGRGPMHPRDGGDRAAAGAARGEAGQQVG